jgi:signal transduction histidine kinase
VTARRRRHLRHVNHSLIFDVAVALALTGLLQLQVWTGTEAGGVFESKPLSSGLMLLLTVPLIWRRRAPFAVAASNGAGRAVQALVTGSWVATHGITLATIVALYAAGAYGKRWRGWVGLVCVDAGLLVANAYDRAPGEGGLWNALFFYLLTLFVFAIGLYVGGRRQSRELQRRTERLERERAEQAHAIAEERARIARELHDVVAHGLSATVIQAEAAEGVLAREPEKARRSLHRIQATSREALREMRRLLKIVRAPESTDDDLSPQPRLDQLDRLVEAAGDEPRVELRVDGARREVPPGVDLSAYRIVQEALTNVRRHAGRSASVTVTVHYGEGSLDIEIADDGTGPQSSDGFGHGLIGMRERVLFFGGRFSAGPGEKGGFVVRASFPLAAESS